MRHEDMRLHDPACRLVCGHSDIYEGLLPLDGARILELGCGKAEVTKAIARSAKGVSITALEVDRIQHELNCRSDLPNVRFELGGAEEIPAADDAFDIVMMFKSLHHVSGDKLDRALAEVHRVLKPGGLAYLAEPVFAGDYNDILRIFHDEEKVRLAAFAAVRRAVESGLMELVTEKFFLAPLKYENFTQFEERVINVTHTDHRLTPQQFAQVREKFLRHMTKNGAVFFTPMRVDLLRKPPMHR